MKKDVPHVVITAMNRYSYYQWFLLGLYYMEREGRIRLSFRLHSLYEWLSFVNRGKVMTGFRRLAVKHNFHCRWIFAFSNNLEGYVVYGGKRRYFCIDSNDNPYSFDSALLEKVSVYFKMQCPKEINEEGFRLTDEVVLPWLDQNIERNPKEARSVGRKRCDNLMQHKHKVKPLMIGPRMMSRGNAFRWLDESFRSYHDGLSNGDRKKMMCYFGNAMGPTPRTTDPVDLDKEHQVMGYFAGKLNHPNEKRSRTASILRSLGSDYDARVIDESVPGFKSRVSHPEWVVPLDKFCDHISHFQYNLNISGYGMSIPNRFIESFLVGTAIVTDRMSVQWYKPFGMEVVETVPMGYLPMDAVDWNRFEEDIKSLPEVSRDEVQHAFDEKWHPLRVAEYIVRTLLEA